MRVGILGGTFDPVHNAHLVLAEHAADALALDLVLFIPAGEPWRKTHDPAPAEHRLAMLRLAVEGNERFGISDIELKRSGPTYTADTLEALAAERLDDEFWLILGADALADMPNWHEPERISRHAHLAVAPRQGEPLPAAAEGVRIDPIPMPAMDISSSDIRRRIAANDSIDDVVPAPVADYINSHRLYHTPEASKR